MLGADVLTDLLGLALEVAVSSLDGAAKMCRGDWTLGLTGEPMTLEAVEDWLFQGRYWPSASKF